MKKILLPLVALMLSVTATNAQVQGFDNDLQAVTAMGTCEATFTLTTLIKKSFLDYTTVGKSSDITIRFINRDPSAINGVADNSAAKEVARYTVGGQRINAPVKGINIVKLSDGRTVKVNVK